MRLIKTAAPDRWRDIVAGYRIIGDDRAAIAQCERSEARTTARFAAPLKSEAQIQCKASTSRPGDLAASRMLSDASPVVTMARQGTSRSSARESICSRRNLFASRRPESIKATGWSSSTTCPFYSQAHESGGHLSPRNSLTCRSVAWASFCSCRPQQHAACP